VIGDQFDTYLEPLVEALRQLWDIGVDVGDATTFNGKPTSTCM
jgi:hypothetical protein